MREHPAQRPPVGAPSRHSSSPRTLLLRAGFQNATRAGALLDDPALRLLLSTDSDADDADRTGGPSARPSAGRAQRPGGRAGGMRLGPGAEELIESLALTADPDMALLSLVRLAEVATAAESRPAASPDDVEPGCTPTPAALLRGLLSAPDAGTREHRRRLLAVLGASQALGDFLVAHPERITALAPARAWDAPQEPGAAEKLRREVQGALGTAPSDGDEGPQDPGGQNPALERATATVSPRSSPMTSPARTRSSTSRPSAVAWPSSLMPPWIPLCSLPVPLSVPKPMRWHSP